MAPCRAEGKLLLAKASEVCLSQALLLRSPCNGFNVACLVAAALAAGPVPTQAPEISF